MNHAKVEPSYTIQIYISPTAGVRRRRRRKRRRVGYFVIIRIR